MDKNELRLAQLGMCAAKRYLEQTHNAEIISEGALKHEGFDLIAKYDEIVHFIMIASADSATGKFAPVCENMKRQELEQRLIEYVSQHPDFMDEQLTFDFISVLVNGIDAPQNALIQAHFNVQNDLA